MMRALAAWKQSLPILRRLVLPVLIVIFLAKGIAILPGYRYQMNPDGVSYLVIAGQYLRGHWHDALNAYWSPLYSWLLVPLLKLGIEPLLATKVLALLVGAATIAIVWWLGGHLRITRDMRVIIAATLMPILYYFGMIVTTPDLLVACTILLYLAQMTTPDYHRRWHSGAVSGLLAGLAYLAKAYALPFLLVHFVTATLLALWTTWRCQRRTNVPAIEPAPADRAPSIRRIAAHFLLGLASLTLVAGVWGAALASKYGAFTLGSTGRFNLAWNGPDFVIPMHAQGFLAPPNPTGTSGWDDATVFHYPTWNPLGTAQEREHFSKNRQRNWNSIKKSGEHFTWLFWPIVIAGAVVVASRADPFPRRPGRIILLALLLYPVGYYFLHVEERFLATFCILLLILGGFVVGGVAHELRIGPLRRILAIGFVCWSFLDSPKWNPETDPYAMALGRWSIARMWGNGEEFHRQADVLAGLLPPRARVASAGQWGRSLYLSYLLDLRYFGESRPGAAPAEIEPDLAKFNIDYFWVWGNPRQFPFVAGLLEVSGHGIANLHIYQTRRPPATGP